MADKKQEPTKQPPRPATPDRRKLTEDTAALSWIRGGQTVTNTRPAPAKPDKGSGGGKDDK